MPAKDPNYAKKNFKHFHLKVPNHETEVIEMIMAQSNKNRFVIDCIKEHIEREAKNEPVSVQGRHE